MSNKIWKKEYNPFRNIILWGFDSKNNPSFLILYGSHEFESSEETEDSVRNILKDEVTYTSYCIFKGRDGHLPSFESVRIIDGGYYDDPKFFPKMYYKTGVTYNWYWTRDENYLVKEFVKLEEKEYVTIPYFQEIEYEKCVDIIENSNVRFHGFRLAKNPNEVLNLKEEFSNYYSVICNILSNENLYIRKKNLRILIGDSPSEEIYDLLFNIGSCELISGLFLELAKIKNPIFLDKAKEILRTDIKWADESYVKGVKRCASIYINSLDEDFKKEREAYIKEHLPEMDLHLIHINGKDIPENKILEGAHYRKYAHQELLREYYQNYDYQQREWTKTRAPQRYNIGLYSDGVVLDIVSLKNTIQEADIYGFADVIGKVAYYLDAPRLYYYFKGNGEGRALKYFKRYIKRIINSYGENDHEKFIIAMKTMLTSYTKYDYLCKFRGNFQFNEFIKYYLYHDFKEKAPNGWDNWLARQEWMENDQLMKLEGRHEFMKEIWDEHLQDVLYIAINSNVDSIFKACYYILKDSEKTNDLINKMSYKELSNLTQISYEPLASMFMNILKEKLEGIEIFDANIFIDLMASSSEEINNIALNFLRKTNGYLKSDDIVKLIFIGDIDKNIKFFKESLLGLDESNYIDFIKSLINNSIEFKESNVNISEDIKDILSFSTARVSDVSNSEKKNLIEYIILSIFNKTTMPKWVEDFINEVIFSLNYEDLTNILKDIDIRMGEKPISLKNRQVISLLESIKNQSIPANTELISILESGTSKMIRIMFEIIHSNKEELKKRFSTILIMLESNITILNSLAESVFDSINKEEKKNLHKMIIDSPVSKVYLFGLRKLSEIYGEFIPSEFMIQMLEHTSSEVKSYISNKANEILNNLEDNNKDLFMYYIKTLLFLPNKVSKSKEDIYKVIPKFIYKHNDKLKEIEKMLLDIGGSNIIKDSEAALIALAKIRREEVQIEG